MFHDYIAQFPANDIRTKIIELFKILDTQPADRDPYLDDCLAEFPYVNGGLFKDETIEIPYFNDKIKNLILSKASEDFDWSNISPTIFGALFESTLNPITRRGKGIHYTSIENIHKEIDPLVLNQLTDELSAIKRVKNTKTRIQKADAFRVKLSKLKFLDPACGSDNFLTETYISLRRMENEAIKMKFGDQSAWDSGDIIKVSIQQFYGIEINDFAVTVAKTALWIAETEKIVRHDIPFLPLHNYANIVQGNALRIDWERLEGGERVEDRELESREGEVREGESIPGSLFYIPLTSNLQSLFSNTLISKYDYIMGNPPFVGFTFMSAEQKEDMECIFQKTKNLDFVCAWYKKANDLIKGTKTERAFVSTNSIVQGKTVAAFWKFLDFNINFACQTFKWESESLNKAHVHCVIVGFADFERKEKLLFNG